MAKYKIVYTDFFDDLKEFPLSFVVEAENESEAFYEWYDCFNRGRAYHSRIVSIKQI